MRLEMKMALSICALILAAGFVHAAEDIYWANGQDPLKDRNDAVIAAASGWVVAVFKTGGDNAIDNYNDIIAQAAGADDQLVAMYAYVGSGGADGYFAQVFSTATGNPPSGFRLNAGDKIYSRIFDAASIADAHWCAVIDNTLVTVPDYTYPPGIGWEYDPGELTSADWIEITDVVGPQITANGWAGDAHLISGDAVTIAVQMMNIDPYLGVEVDWWVVAYAHSGEWYYLNNAGQWLSFNGDLAFCQPVYQGPLFNLPSTPVLSGYTLPLGTYDFWFAIDYPMDGILDLNGQILFDKVTVVVQ